MITHFSVIFPVFMNTHLSAYYVYDQVYLVMADGDFGAHNYIKLFITVVVTR